VARGSGADRDGVAPRREHAREDFVASPAESAIASSATDAPALGDIVAVAASVDFGATK